MGFLTAEVAATVKNNGKCSKLGSEEEEREWLFSSLVMRPWSYGLDGYYGKYIRKMKNHIFGVKTDYLYYGKTSFLFDFMKIFNKAEVLFCIKGSRTSSPLKFTLEYDEKTNANQYHFVTILNLLIFSKINISLQRSLWKRLFERWKREVI